MKNMQKIVAVMAALIVTTSAFAGEFPDMSVADVKALIESKKGVIIDANGSEAYAKGHVPGAIDYQTAKANLASLLPKDKNAPIVAYCGGPQCTAYQSPAKAAKELGYTNVKHMSAGISGWMKSGEKVEKAN